MTIAGLCLGAAVPRPIYAQSPLTAEDFYRLGVTALRRGVRFENAVANLQNAVRLSPERADFQTALGCACASRAASLASAAEKISLYQTLQTEYLADLAKWQTAQKTGQTAETAAAPRPVAPVLRTPDDGLPFLLSDEEAARTVKTLAAAARAAFDAGSARCKSDGEKSSAAFVRGWGTALLRKYKTVRDQMPELSHQKVVDAFSVCIALAPENAAAYHARGASRFPLFMRDDNTETSAHAEPKADEYADGIADLARVLSFKAKNFDVLYQLSLATETRDETASLAYLRKAVALKPENAILNYYLAKRLLLAAAKMPDKEAQPLRNAALTITEQAARARQMQAERIVLPVPPELLAAWNYNEVYANNQDYRVVLFLAVAVRDYLESVKNPDEILRWAKALVQVGESETGNYEAAAKEGSTDAEARSAQRLRCGIGASAYGLGVGFAERIKDNFKNDPAFTPVFARRAGKLQNRQAG